MATSSQSMVSVFSFQIYMINKLTSKSVCGPAFSLPLSLGAGAYSIQSTNWFSDAVQAVLYAVKTGVGVSIYSTAGPLPLTFQPWQSAQLRIYKTSPLENFRAWMFIVAEGAMACLFCCVSLLSRFAGSELQPAKHKNNNTTNHFIWFLQMVFESFWPWKAYAFLVISRTVKKQ